MFQSQFDKWKNRSSSNRNRQVRRRKFEIELLENRSLLAVVTWDGGAGTLNWTDANNWDNNLIPATVDSVVIPDLAGTPTIVYGSGTRTVASIQTAEILSVTAGSLSINGNLSGVGSLRVAGGTQSFLGTNWTNTSTLVLSSGTLNLGGSFTQFNLGAASPVARQGMFTRSGGTVNLIGTLTGDLTLDSTTGAWILGGSGRMLNGTLKSSSVVNQTGTFTLDNVKLEAMTAYQVASSGFGVDTNIQNGLTIDGELRLGSGVEKANMKLAGTQTIGGSGSITFGAAFNNNITTTVAGYTITFGPALKIGGAIGRFDGAAGSTSYIFQGLLQPYLAGGSMTFTSNVSSVRNEGMINPINGSRFVFNGTALNNVGTIIVTPTNTVELNGSGVFSNTSTITATGGSLTLGGIWANTGLIGITNTTVSLSGSFTQYGMGAATPALGQGTFTRSGGTVNLVGLVTGNVTLDAVTGPWNLATGAFLKNGVLVSDVPVDQSGSMTFDGMTIARGTVVQPEQSDEHGAFVSLSIVNGLTIDGDLRLGNSSHFASMRMALTQTIGGSGSITFGTFDNGSYISSIEPADARSTITFGPALTIGGAFGQIVGGSTSYILQGLLQPNVVGGSIKFSSSLRNEGTINPINGSSVVFNGGALTNVGIITVSPTNSVTLTPTTFTNSNAITATGGTLTLGGAWTNTGNISVINTAVTLAGSFTQYNMGAASPSAGQGTFTRSGGTVNLSGTINGALTLNAVTGPWTFGGGGRLKDGTLTTDTIFVSTGAFTLDNYVISAGSVVQQIGTSNYTLNVVNGLTIHGVLQLGSGTIYSHLTFGNTQTIGGTGAIVFANNTSNTVDTSTSGFTITFGPTLTLRGDKGTISNNASYILQGSLKPDVSTGSITVHSSVVSFTNQGRIEPTSGSTVTISSGTFNNHAPIVVSATNTVAITTATWTDTGSYALSGGTLTVSNTAWQSVPVVNITGGTFNIGGILTLANLAALTRHSNAGTVNLTGTLTIPSNGTLALNGGAIGFGTWNLAGGIIVGGSVSTSNAAQLRMSSGTLNGVTLATGSDVLTETIDVGGITIVNGLTVNGKLTLGSGQNQNISGLFFSGTQTLSGYSGEVVSNGNQGLWLIQSNMTLTIGTNLSIHSGRVTIGAASPATNTTVINNGAIRVDGPGTLVIGVSPPGNSFIFGATNLTNLVNNGTMVVSHANATIEITSTTFLNYGQIAVEVGTINVTPITFTNFTNLTSYGNTFDATLSGGSYYIGSEGILRLFQGTDTSNVYRITRLAAHLILVGSGSTLYGASVANYDALSGLNAIDGDGQLRLIGGRNLSPFGVFTNRGRLFVDKTSSFGAAATGPAATNGLVSSYAAEGNGNDGTGSNNATLVNGATFGPGISGQAFLLDGENDYVSIPTDASLRSPNLTVEGWFKFSSVPNGAVLLFSKTLGVNSTDDSYAVWYDAGTLNYGFSNGSFAFASIPFAVDVGVWRHLAFTFDDLNDIVSLYVDGVSLSSFSTTSSILYDANSPHVFGADIESGDPGFFFPGSIDDTRIYNRALSSTEVRNNYLSIAATKLIQTVGETHNDGVITSQGEFTLSGGALDGNGTIWTNVNNTGGIVAPRKTDCLTINGNLNQGIAGTQLLEVYGTVVCSGYGQLLVNGTVSLGGVFDLSLSEGFQLPVTGLQFCIIDNDGTDAVIGTFDGLPERGIFAGGDELFQISYVGGTGNDVVLTSLGQGVVVTTTAATGFGSFIEAIDLANGRPGLDLIAFAIPATSQVGGTYLIDHGDNDLPQISNPIVIDASTQFDYVNRPIIELRSPSNRAGLRLNTGSQGSQVRGVSLTGWQTGVTVAANNVVIAGNYIGVAADGLISVRNQVNVSVINGASNVRIGGANPADRNVISGAADVGLLIRGASQNKVQGNYIGTDPTGTQSRNNQVGIFISSDSTVAKNNLIGGSEVGTGNLVSGNTVVGIVLDEDVSQNVIVGNRIGTDLDGTAMLGNGTGIEVLVNASDNVVGGMQVSERNIISGNRGPGIAVRNGAQDTEIQGNLISLNQGVGVDIASGTSGTVLGGVVSGQRNTIVGNLGGGVHLEGSGTSFNYVLGNYVGLNDDGETANPNQHFGLLIDDLATHNLIGNGQPGAGNRIVGSGTASTGILIRDGAAENEVHGNWIGLNAAGTAAIGYVGTGISILNAPNNGIGGRTNEDRNVIVQYTTHGIAISGATSTDNFVGGNYVGVRPDGTAAMFTESHGTTGIAVLNAPFNFIGGFERGNLVGGNQTGISISGALSLDNAVYGNTVGLNSNGSVAIPNYWGILIGDAKNTIVGGFGAGERNIISGNSIGVSIYGASDNTFVANNWIGTDGSGATNPGIANRIYGVEVEQSTRTMLDGNSIVRSGTTGASTNNSGANLVSGDTQLTRNLIFHNLGPSISVANSAARVSLTQARVDGFALGNVIGATPNTTYTIEFFAANLQGQAEQYIGLSAVATDENGEATFEASGLGDLPPGRFLTATITGANAEGGDLLQTSELAAGVIPTAAIIRGLSSRSPEGTPISLKAFALASTINGYAVTGYQWNVSKGGIRYATGTEAGIQFAPDDEGIYVVTLQLTLTNAVGDQQTSLLGPHSIAVFNVAPTPQFDFAPTSPRLGQLLTLKSNSSDPGQLDVLSYAWEVRYGSASGPVVFSKSPSTNPTATIASFTPTAGGLYFAKLTIDDNDGGATGFRTLTRQIDVSGLPSIVTILAPSTGSEGQTVRARVPESELIRAEQFGFAWTVTKTPVTGPVVAYPFTVPSRGVVEFIPDDDGVYRIALVMQELANGGSLVATPVDVVITNASPIVAVTSLSNSAMIGSPINVVAAITDPGTADTYTLVWSIERNGKLLVGAGTVGNPAKNFTFTPTRGGVYTIKAVATDDDYSATTGIGRGTGQRVFYVSDVGIALTINGPAGPFTESNAYSFTSTLGTLPSGVTVTSYTWSAQNINGRVVQSDSATAATIPSFVFRPPQGGLFLVSLSVVLSNGQIANAASAPFSVVGLAPIIDSISVVSPLSTVTITEGMEVTVRASATDAGEPIGLSYQWQLKRGTAAFFDVEGVSTKPTDMKFTPTDDDTYTVRVIVTDSRGNAVQLDRAIAVANAAPSVRLEVASVSGTSVIFNAIGNDPGLDDRPGLAYAWSVNGLEFVTGTSQSPLIDVSTASTLAVRVTDDTTSTIVSSYIFADAAGTNSETIDVADQTLAGAADQIIYLGLGGNDTVTVATGLTKKVVVFGGDGNDTLDASLATSPVYLDGGAGDDRLTGGSGNDVLIAGPGTNVLIGGNGNNRFVGGGNDTMTGGVNDDYYEVHFSTVVLNDLGGGLNTVDLTAAPSGVTLDFSQTTGNIAQSVFPTSPAGAPFHGSTLTLNGTFQALIGTPFGDSLSASTPGVMLSGGAGSDTLSATGPDSALDGGADNDLLILSNASGVIVGGDGNDSFTGTLSNLQTTILDGGNGDDTWNITGPSTGPEADVAITGGPGVNTVTASNIKGKISTEGGNATGLLSEFGSVVAPSTLIATVTNSSDISIFGGTIRGSTISVSSSNDINIFGGGGDSVSLLGVLRGTIQGGLFGGVATANPLTANVTNSNDIGIFGGSTQQSLLISTITNSNDISIFGGLKSQITVTNSTDIGIFGVSDGSIDIGAPIGLRSTGVKLHISDFGSVLTSPVLSVSVTNSTDIGIFGSAAPTAAPLLATVTNSNDVSIFGSASRNVNLNVTGSQDIGIFGIVDGNVQLGPSDTSAAGQGVTRATIETAGFGSVSISSSLNVSVTNSNDIGIFGSSLATRPLNTVVTNSNDISIFGSVVRGGIVQATNSQDISIYAQASSQVLMEDVGHGNIFAETFGTVPVPSRLTVSVAGNSNDIGIFGGTNRNSIVSVSNSTDISIFGGTAVNTIEGVTYVGDTVAFDTVASGTIAGGVFGAMPPPEVSSMVLRANLQNSANITVFGSVRGVSSVSVVNSQEISIFGGFGDSVDLINSNRVRVEGGVFGSATPNQLGLTASVAGNSSDVGIFGTNVNDTVKIVGGTRIGVDTRAGNDILRVSNVNTLVGLTDAGDDFVTVDSGTNILLYLAAGSDRAQINGGSDIRVIGAEDDDAFFVTGGNNIDLDGGDGADTSIFTGGSALSVRSDAGNDAQKIFGVAKGYFSGGTGNETTQLYGGSGTASLPGQIDVVIDGQAGDDTLEIRPLLNAATRASSVQPDPYAGIPAWVVLPSAITSLALNRNPSSVAVIGGDGNDTLVLEGNQRLYALGGDGDDIIRLIAGSNSFAVGGSGNDTIEINSPGIDNYVFGDQGNDSVQILGGIRLAVFTEEGDDSVLFSGSSQSYARTGEGQDTITVDSGSDLIVSAENGFDTINLNGGTNILAGGGSDGDLMTVFGGANPILLGESGNDHLSFVAGTNAILSGGDGDDLIEASGRNVDLYGDDGDDRYKILPTSSTASFQLKLRELQFIDPSNFESQSRGFDTIDLSAFSTGADVDLRNADSLQSVLANQLSLFFTGSFEGIVGTNGDDILTGTNSQNRIEGRGGNDSLFGLAGDDVLVGGTGNDTLEGGLGDDQYRFETTTGVGLGNDTIYEVPNGGTDLVDFSGLPVGLGNLDLGTATRQSLAGGLLTLTNQKSASDNSVGEIEDLIGTLGNDTVIGNSLENRFEMLAGDDAVTGGGGSDIYVFRGRNLGSDTITESVTGTGRDTLDFTGFDAPLTLDLSSSAPQNQSGQLSLTLTGVAAIENVLGTSFNDTILGNELENAIFGAAGSDTLDGRAGNDRLVAGLPAVVLLDFDSAYSAVRGDYNYSNVERNAIQQRMEADYAAFDWRFTQSESRAKSWTLDMGRSFVRLTFSAGRGGGVSGDAGEIDFRNTNRRIISEVNINSLKSTIAELLGPGYTQQAYSDMVVALTTTIASHELAHTAGVRHADAFGPIGTGVFASTNTDRIYPVYSGSKNAVETPWHLISSPASSGSSIADAARDLFFGEREAIKLAFNEMGQTLAESSTAIGGHNTRATAENLSLAQLNVPNLLPATGFVNSGKVFDVSAMAVAGELKYTAAANSTEIDYYQFTGRAGEYVNIELLANSILPLRGEAFDDALKIFKSDGTPLAENDDDFEGTKDSTLQDVQLPVDGQYFVAVSLSSDPSLPGKGGRYELFLSRFKSLPAGSVSPTVVGDTLIGGAGSDSLTGGYADDFFAAVGSNPGDLADVLNGGPGRDTLDLMGLDYLYSATSIESIINPPAPAPTLSLTGPANAAIGQPLVFGVALANVPASATLSIDWGDGNSLSQSTSNGSIVLNKIFAAPSPVVGFGVIATLRNSANTVILTRTLSTVVTSLLVVEEAGQRVLHGGGTTGNDTISVRRINNGQFGIKLASTGVETIFSYGTGSTPIQRLALYGMDGNDSITVDTQLLLPVSLYGGSGNDVLRGGGGDDILVGGDGIDQLYGFGGSDLLIGGTGRDTLYGAGDQDIFIAGTTLWDENANALQSILSYWTSNATVQTIAWYQTRVATLRDVGVGAGVWRLNATTTIDDNALDIFYAAAGVTTGSVRKLNWYLRNTLGTGVRDSLIGGIAGEESTDNRDA